ncbi:MAG: site-2 protease family protein [Acidobacteria bacterium]|nr:MAG: site-2 protease family protein [Acidobacteriota bacterium]
MPHIDFAQIFFGFVVLLFSLTVHEMAHAWTADQLGDPTARLLGRVSLNPIVHADLIGTVIFPLIAMISGVPLIGWAKPVPVNPRQLGHPRRDFMLVAAAGPASNLVMAVGAAMVLRLLPVSPVTLGEPNLSVPIASLLGQAMRLNVLLAVFNMIPIPPLDGGNVYGFLLIYALMMSRGFEYLVIPPSRLLISWLQ